MIRLLVTGGTIEGLEYDSEDELPKNHKSVIPSMLRQGRSQVKIAVEELMAKDSKFVNDNDRDIMLKRIKDCSENKIIITHGTMTMPATARYLGPRVKGKTVVILGSMVPAVENDSDASFNLGASVIAVQLLGEGVYVCMNGLVFGWENVRKNMESGVFESD